MKKIYKLASFAILTLFISQKLKAQIFSGGGGLILDNQETCVPVFVSGLPNTIDSTFGIKKVCLNLVHTYDSDIKIKLKGADGTVIILSNNNGGGGDNYTGTCFFENASTNVANGNPPFSGNFIPDQSINILNNGQNPNGMWFLCVQDEVPVDTGHIINFSIEFGADPPPTPIDSSCNSLSGLGCSCPDGTQNCDLLPDMINASHYIQSDHQEFAGNITLGTSTPNIGYGPLELRGINSCFCDTIPVSCAVTNCPNGDPPTQLVNQRIYHKNGAAITYYDVPAGTMSYHPTHGHIHVDHWVYNTLRIKGPGNNPATWPIIGEGTKVSFCLVNLGDCDNNLGDCTDTLGNILHVADIPNTGLGTVTGCGTEQGIFNGNLDIYSSGLNGNGIEFGDICNGKYYIVSTTDPFNIVTELNELNNSSVTPIVLTIQTLGNCCSANFYADTLNGAAPFQVQFADSTMPEPLTWLWNFGDGATSTQQFPVHVYTTPGNYTVSLYTTGLNSCNSNKTKSQYIHVNTGSQVAAMNNKEIKFELSPNPVTDVTNISYELTQPTVVKLTLTDVTGREIMVLQNGMQPRGTHQMQFDMNRSGLPGGLYFLHINAGATDQTIKVVKLN